MSSTDEELSQSVFSDEELSQSIFSRKSAKKLHNNDPVDTNCFPPFNSEKTTQDLNYRNFLKIIPGLQVPPTSTPLLSVDEYLQLLPVGTKIVPLEPSTDTNNIKETPKKSEVKTTAVKKSIVKSKAEQKTFDKPKTVKKSIVKSKAAKPKTAKKIKISPYTRLNIPVKIEPQIFTSDVPFEMDASIKPTSDSPDEFNKRLNNLGENLDESIKTEIPISERFGNEDKYLDESEAKSSEGIQTKIPISEGFGNEGSSQQTDYSVLNNLNNLAIKSPITIPTEILTEASTSAVQISFEGFERDDIKKEIALLHKKVDSVYILEKNNQRKLDAILKLLKAVDEEFDFETTSTIDEFKNLNEQIESNDRFASFFINQLKKHISSKNNSLTGAVKFIMSDKVLMEYNWDGRAGKMGLSGFKLFKTILRDLYVTATRSQEDYVSTMRKEIEKGHSRSYTQKSLKRKAAQP